MLHTSTVTTEVAEASERAETLINGIAEPDRTTNSATAMIFIGHTIFKQTR
jgi:hypothetical protein